MAVERVEEARRRGRGAALNESGRFESAAREPFHDGWDSEAELPPFKTTVSVDASRTIIARNSSPDLPFDRSINPYRGCEHGCVYCFARPTHAYLGLSPGLDFETRLFVKPNAARLLEKELSAKRYSPKTIAIGTNTDPYQPVERTRRVMRAVLETLAAHNHPVTIVTKGALAARDADILGEMGRAGLARVAFSVTTLDPLLARAMEPRASTPARRLWAMEQLRAAGCPVAVMVAPVIPALNDAEMEAILEAARGAGADWASYIVLRLPREVKGLFRDWLAERRPSMASRVMRHVREVHGGRDYDAEFGKRMSGEGVYAALIARRFEAAAKRLGYRETPEPLRTDLFSPPPKAGDQFELF